MTSETIEPFNTGDITASYVAPEMTLSGIAFMGSDGYTKNVTWIDKDEMDENPGRWDCAIEFENLSTFEVLLREVEVYRETAKEHIFKRRSDRQQHMIVDEERLDVTLSPDTENKWSKSFVFPDPKEEPVMKLPSFGQKVDFSVKSMFLRELTGSVAMPGIEVTVAAMDLEKSFDTNEISAAETKPIMTTLAVSNTGSAQFNDLTFEETIPPGFDVVDQDKIDVNLIRPIEGTTELQKMKILKAAKVDLPSEKDLKKERKLILSLRDVRTQGNIGAILPGDRVEVEYPLQPVTPEPGTEHTPPFTATADVLPPFTEAAKFDVSVEEEKLTIKPYVWRKVRVGKSIQEGATKGEYAITIFYKNKLKSGELALVTDEEASLPDITINDILPEGFTLVSSDPDVSDRRPRLVEGKSFTVLEWSLKDVSPDQMVEIKYTLKGEPGAVYKAREAQALLTA
jgi:hypothetical protein